MNKNSLSVFISFLLISFASLSQNPPKSSVTVREEKVVIPTYMTGNPEQNPMFFFGRQSQGAEGRIYPYPLFDTMTDEKKDKPWLIVYLENEYLKIGIAPELGGRIFSGLDKTNSYNFFYRQSVIKPQLIGLIGAWISGGVEWNIPHHHRATTFMPVQYRIEENTDGSKTVWVGELELRHRMRWAVGYTLHPGKSYLELSLRIVNRTPLAQSMLCFANAAVHTNENYQVIFPPSTRFGTFHHKKEFVSWPIANSIYNGADFTNGVDISWYKNHYKANSVFAWNYTDDFLAGYDHGREAGVLSIADHHIIPGKKFWTWGNGPQGKMWDKLLTDDDGPYIELMVGAYSDNQPDYSWLQPYETRSFTEYWYPFQKIGGVKNANLSAAVNFEATGSRAKIGFCTTTSWLKVKALLKSGDKVIFEKEISIDPANPFITEINLPDNLPPGKTEALLLKGDSVLVSYTPSDAVNESMPEPYTDPPSPAEIKTNEELYLAGLRIEQFHHPVLDAEPYWEEALRRDPLDVRVNLEMGIKALNKAIYPNAEEFLRRSLIRLTHNYTSPKDGESYYYLGECLKQQGRNSEAFDSFYKAVWSAAFRAQGYYGLAEISCRKKEFREALEFIDKAILFDGLNLRALNLKAAILRHTGNTGAVSDLLTKGSHSADPLDVRAMAEKWMATGDIETAGMLGSTMVQFPATVQETAAEYLDAGLYDDGLKFLSLLTGQIKDPLLLNPMIWYYKAYFAAKSGDKQKASEYNNLAGKCSADYVFPFQSEAIMVLENAIALNPGDARPYYYLGNLLFDWQPVKAIAMWEKAVALDPKNAVPWRNLAIAYSHSQNSNDLNIAVNYQEKAVSADKKYALHFTELDELYEALAESPEKRLSVLQKNIQTVKMRDDAYSRLVFLEILSGNPEKAIEMMKGRKFEIWEGGTLSVAGSWIDAHLMLAKKQLTVGNPSAASQYIRAAEKIPENIPSETKGKSDRQEEINYLKGLILQKLKNKKEADACMKLTANDEKVSGTQLYYRGLARKVLGISSYDADFEQLVSKGEELLKDLKEPEEQASFIKVTKWRQSFAEAYYLKGLGFSGKGEKKEAEEIFRNILKMKPDFLYAAECLKEMGANP